MKDFDNKDLYGRVREEFLKSEIGTDYLLALLGVEKSNNADLLIINYGKNGHSYCASGYVNPKAYRQHKELNSNWYPTALRMKQQMILDFIKWLQIKNLMKDDK